MLLALYTTALRLEIAHGTLQSLLDAIPILVSISRVSHEAFCKETQPVAVMLLVKQLSDLSSSHRHTTLQTFCHVAGIAEC